MKQFLYEVKEYGVRTAWYNVKWSFCYWWLGAEHMKVKKKETR